MEDGKRRSVRMAEDERRHTRRGNKGRRRGEVYMGKEKGRGPQRGRW